MPANPAPAEVSQPDGTRIRVSLRGDEFYKWHEDEKGYTILKDTSTLEWAYAERDARGALIAGRYKVGAHDPAKLGLPKRLIDTGKAARAKTARARRDTSPTFSISGNRVPGAPARTPILNGTMKNLVILARFSDLAPTHTPAEFSDLFNKDGYNTDGAAGSVRDYYREVSYGKLTVQSTVTVWVTLPNTFDYYGTNGADGLDGRPQEMARDAIGALAAAGFDFSVADGNGDGEVDGLDIIHSGPGEEYFGNDSRYIWSHKWELAAPITKNGVTMSMYHTEPELRGAGPDITRIGVICHETGHFLGLPDLYDTTGASAGAGSFCLMATGSWNGVSSDGRSPAHPSAWCKKTLGWAAAAQPLTSGAYSLPRIEDNSAALYLLRSPAFPSTEYFLAENRQNFGFDSGLPGPDMGMLIWHVDESVANNDNPAHYLVDLEEADGVQHLELSYSALGTDVDYFRLDNKSTFGDATVPGSKSYYGSGLGILMSGISASADPMTFNLAGVEASLASMNSMDRLKAYPNPCYFNGSQLTISGMPLDPDPKIYIYNAAGELVRTLQRGDGINSFNTAVWNGRDKSGAKAASGLYIYLAKTANSGKATGKFYIFW